MLATMMMRQFCIALLLFSALYTEAFQSAFTGTSVIVSTGTAFASRSTLTMEYIPTGMSKEEWKKLKEKERNNSNKNLGKVGITKFQSRTLTDWQKAGGKNLFPVDPKTVKSKKEIPYMMRPGGSANDEDLKTPNPLANLFGGGKKKIEPKKEPPATNKDTNWWTLK